MNNALFDDIAESLSKLLPPGVDALKSDFGELERVQVSYLASMNRYDRTAARRTARQAGWWIQGHPPGRRADLERIIAGATLASVNSVIREVLDPENYVLVEAGMVPE